MKLRRLPLRLRRRTHVIAIQCGCCGQWRKPRHIRVPAVICRDCEPLIGGNDRTPSTGTTPAEPMRTATR